MKANIIATKALYSTGKAAQLFTAVTGGAGFASELVGGIPGMPEAPPAYIPDGLPPVPPLAPWKTGSAVGAGVRDGYLIFRGHLDRK
jgi:hypothetical protein